MSVFNLSSLLVTAALVLCSATSLYAAPLKVPVGQQGGTQTQIPQNGATRQNVLRHFGQPKTAHPKVGKPPITRWDYSEFSVYFEYDRVISSVRHHSSSASAAKASSEGAAAYDIDLRTPRSPW